jgi:hypothetical protein
MTYSIAPAPKLASQYEWDCALCGHETLARPIFLATPAGNVIAAGSGCAAVALYGDVARARKVRNEFDAVTYAARQRDEMIAERIARYTAALADFHAGEDSTPALISTRATYWATVRGAWNGEHRMTFPAFLAAVASDGDLVA